MHQPSEDRTVPVDVIDTFHRADPENYIRINISKTAKEYRAETTVSLRWNGAPGAGEEHMKALLRRADDLARNEIARREFEDRAMENGR